MNELWIVRFVCKDGKPDEEYYYRSLAEAEHHKNLFLNDDSGLYERIEIISATSVGRTLQGTEIYPRNEITTSPTSQPQKPEYPSWKWG